ncbi:MAG: hypothetical protein FJX53_14710, partial [Alphaproteobacteria bacterium]|nr:hypothetical protein [Alphaproteobacteria bacterium]
MVGTGRLRQNGAMVEPTTRQLGALVLPERGRRWGGWFALLVAVLAMASPLRAQEAPADFAAFAAELARL